MAEAPGTTPVITLTTPVHELAGVSRAHAEGLHRLGIPSLAHLIYHLPHRHELEQAEGTIAQTQPGATVSVRGEITDTKLQRFGRPRFEAVLIDDTGRLELVWFNQTYLARRLHPGDRLRVQGKASVARSGSLRLTNPRWEQLKSADDDPPARKARLRPIYPAAEDIPSWAIEKAIDEHLDSALPLLEDHLPPDYRSERSLPSLADAYRMIHRPESQEEIDAARRRFIYDELLLLQLGVAMKRSYIRRAFRAPPLPQSEAIDSHIRARFPFALTPGQDTVIRDIAQDLAQTTPANRLLQGDVGSGKTAVALYAMLLAVAAQHQATLMAPTELLAEQHFKTISALLSDSNVRTVLLTGSLSASERNAVLEGVRSGEVDIAIGTHALLTHSVEFRSLALAVIDEQHRFGVHQRATLREKATHSTDPAALCPHVLVMTATPIPRTLSLTIFGDLDVSTLTDMPPGRTPVATRLIHGARRGEVHEYIRARIDRGDQAYVVVPAIGEEETDSLLRTVLDVQKTLQAGPLADHRVASVHGRLKQDQRERIMAEFRTGAIDALVATSVIEVGLDVPNATLIVIEQAERFGLAQLHQLRGRVGRGAKPGACLLVTGGDSPLTPEAKARLNVLVESNDGFAIAEKDLEIRGPGELIGTKQSGLAPFRLATFPRDLEMLLMARRDARAWIETSPTLALPPERILRSRLLKAHGESLGLADIA